MRWCEAGSGAVARMAIALLLAAMVLAAAVPGRAAAQGLSNLDYEYLSFRGVMLDGGKIFPSKVDPTWTIGGRIDLGFLAPGVRVAVGLNHWSSTLVRKEVGALETRVDELILEQTGQTTNVSLGEITWADTAIHADVHMMWRVPFGLLTYAGMGWSGHVLRGSGPAIDGTFVEDLLDSVRAGLNVHAGVEFPIDRRFRLVSEARYEVLEDLTYLQLRAGGQFTFGALAPGEEP
ncbi:MAG: hypothetical protein EXR92_01680 [Gemmatimonadetes bacterium]|nr:hypothetical protein [Gemmatimonadota bacterium]